jgi:predicted RNA-binding Zn-ribbon protein involved in translation (DUF1610 family)
MFTGIGVVLAAFVVVVGAILIGQMIAARRRLRIATRVAQKRCPKCGYDAVDLATCPECGFVISEPRIP